MFQIQYFHASRSYTLINWLQEKCVEWGGGGGGCAKKRNYDIP